MRDCAFNVGSVLLLVAVLPLVVRASGPSSDECLDTADTTSLLPITCGQVLTEGVPILLTTNPAEQQKTVECSGADPVGVKGLWWILEIPPGQWKVSMTITRSEDASFHAFLSGLCVTANEDYCASSIVSQMGGKWQSSPWSASWDSLSQGTYLFPIVFTDQDTTTIHILGSYTVAVACTPWQPPAQMGVFFSADSRGNAKSAYSSSNAIYAVGNEFPVDSFFHFGVVPQTTWTDQMIIPEAVSGFATWIGSDINGWIVNSGRTLQTVVGGLGEELMSPTLIGEEPPVGCYDMVVDMDNDGIYDAAHDVLVTEAELGAAFCVFPPVPTLNGVATAVMAVLMLSAAAWILRRQ